MINFFQPTEEQIKDATSNGHPTFKHNEEVHFLIKEVNTKPTEMNGQTVDMIIVGCDILNGENAGKTYKHWIRPNQAGVSMWISMLKTFMTDDQIRAGFSPSAPVGRKVKSIAKITAKNGKEYTNFYDFTALDEAPTLAGGVAVSTSDIPF